MVGSAWIWTPRGLCLSSGLVIVFVWYLLGGPEDPLFRSPGPVGQRQVPRGVDQRQVRPLRRPQIRDGTLPEQGHPRDCQPKVERGLWGGSSGSVRINGRNCLFLFYYNYVWKASYFTTICVSHRLKSPIFDINTVLFWTPLFQQSVINIMYQPRDSL